MSFLKLHWKAKGLLLLALGHATILPAAPIISEVMASNKTKLVDEDGAFPDWIEIHNPDDSPVNLAGWKLTDSAGSMGKWVFPAVTLPPGDFLVVFASGKNRTIPTAVLHTNFSLSANGEYLALSAPDGTVSTEFAPVFPPQLEDVSFGTAFSSPMLIAGNATVKYLIPDAGTPQNWKDPTFVDEAWPSGPGGLGFGLLVPGMTVKEVQTPGSMESLAKLDKVLAEAPSGTSTAEVRIRQTINFLGDGADGRFPADNASFALPGFTHGLQATGFLTVPATEAWTFGVSSDDGARLRIDLNGDGDFADTGETVINDLTPHAARDSYGRIPTLTAGIHKFELSYYNSYGGDEVEFFAQSGTFSAWNTGFRLIGDTANGGLSAMVPADGLTSGPGSVVATNLQTSMLGVSSSCYVRAAFNLPEAAAVSDLDLLGLKIRYNDGFAAWLNGVEIARRNAPEVLAFDSVATSARDRAVSLAPENINVGAARAALVAGTNVLAIHALNVSPADDSFLIQPELSGGTLLPGGPFFFKQPTPGTLNSTPATLGPVADTVFSRTRGISSAPFILTITSATPGASIRYTIDGSKPTAATGTLVSPPDPATPPTATLNVGVTTVVRALAFKANFDTTMVNTNTYLFPDDIIRQQPTGTAPAGWPSGSVNGQVLNYGMDPDIVNSTNPAIGGADKVKAALEAIPSICISLPVASLFNISTGIYSHPSEDGIAWEREASIEMINDPASPDGGFQNNCGLRIRGGYSRQTSNPKHAFRVLFRQEYGAGKLDYPLFPGDPTAAVKFDKFDLQTAQNYSWSFEGNATNTFLREIWSRDSQRALKQPATRGRFINLYLNGIYWGLYQIQERAEADYAAGYFGGMDEDYDVIKVETTAGYTINPTAGDLNAWSDMWRKSRASYFINTNRNPVSPFAAATYTQTQKNEAYFKLMGLAADGMTPTADPVLLDVDNLIDYMMIVFVAGNGDAPLVNDGSSPNNYYSMRDRRGGHGFIHFQHDGEHSLNAGGAVSDRTGPYSSATSGPWNQLPKSNPQFTHQDLTPNAEYKIRFADRVHQHMIRPNGPLTMANNKTRLSARASVVETAIIAESARWGDSKVSTPLNANNWRTAVNSTLAWFTNRNTTVLAQLVTDGLYPSVAAPGMSRSGGPMSAGTPLAMTSVVTTIYYTVNGADPRVVGGEIHPSAQTYTPGTEVPLPASGLATVRARVQNTAGTWSAMNEQQFLVDIARAGAGNITVSELMYHPARPTLAEEAAGYTDEQSFQWLELLNTGTRTVDLRGAYFSVGISFLFPDAADATTLLPPGGRCLICENPTAFRLRYGNTRDAVIAGQFNGALAGSGERLVLHAADGSVIMDFTYSDDLPWPVEADGSGHSLVLAHPTSHPDPALAFNWRASFLQGGSPAAGDTTTFEAWKTAANLTDDDADGDGDGLTTLLEYAHGANPVVSSTAPLPRISLAPFTLGTPPITADYLTLTYQRNPQAEDLVYRFEQSPDPSSPSSWTELPVTAVGSIPSGANPEVTVRLNTPFDASSATTARNFLRLRVSRN